MIIDTHAHYDDERFDEDREELLLSMKEKGVEAIVNASASLKGCYDSLALAEKYDFMYFLAGIHPSDALDLEKEGNFDEIKGMAMHEKCVAVGEIGLDYYWDEPDRRIQKKWFEAQLNLANEIRKPINVHSRDAYADTMEIIKSTKAYENGGIIHCFSYGVECAREFLNMGFMLGIGGVLTFKNGKKLKEVVEYAPLDQIVLETDCPYLTPEPFRGQRNDSIKVKLIAEKIAQIKSMKIEDIAEITYKNAYKIYKL